MTDKRGSYFCGKCERYHGFDTKIGATHAGYSPYLTDNEMLAKGVIQP